jgi:2',3'-cyclic-nucleotide 2'-phosphodiesterase/3'-nucleotidase
LLTEGTIVLRWLGVLLCTLVLNAQEVRLQVLTTSDLHGQILPQDSYTLQPANRGWARVASLVRGLRAANPQTLLVDCGNATQGEPIDYVWSRLRPDLPEPSMAIMNSLGCNAMVPGSLEFAQGIGPMRAIEDQAQFPWLAANVESADGRRLFTPYVKLEVGGVQVAILGLSAGPWAGMAPAAAEGSGTALVFRDPVATAKALVPALRDKEKADVVLVALHGGPGQGPCSGEDALAGCLAAQVPGIDLILSSHALPGVAADHDGVPVLQAGAGGQSVGVADLVLRKGARGHWELASRRTRLLTPGADTDPAVLELTAPLRAATETYLNTYATSLAVDLDGRWSRMEDTPLMNLLHTVARQASGAQITALPSPGSRLFIPKGTTSVRQFYALQPEDARLARIRVTGRQLRLYLEHSARFFNFSHTPDLYNRGVDPANFDTLGGCSYVLDISRPPGARVVELEVDNKPVRDDQAFTLGLPLARLGRGGFMEAIGWNGQPEFLSPGLFRNQILEYVLARGTLSPAGSDHWHIIPALDRERVLAQQP